MSHGSLYSDLDDAQPIGRGSGATFRNDAFLGSGGVTLITNIDGDAATFTSVGGEWVWSFVR